MVAYLDDWFFLSSCPLSVTSTIQAIKQLGITINFEKSNLQPTKALVYLGLAIDTTSRTLAPTNLRHLMGLVSIVHQATD
jgi:hypothetical protein